MESFKKQSCFIMQEDQLHMQLTIREALEFASKLKGLTLSLNASKHNMVRIWNCLILIINTPVYIMFCKILDRYYFGKFKPA